MIPLIWFGCLLTAPCGSVLADCSRVHYSHLPLLYVCTLANTVITVPPMSKSGSSLLQGNSWCSCQIVKLLDDNLLHGYKTWMPSTLLSDSHQGGINKHRHMRITSHQYLLMNDKLSDINKLHDMTLTEICWWCIPLSIVDPQESLLDSPRRCCHYLDAYIISYQKAPQHFHQEFYLLKSYCLHYFTQPSECLPQTRMYCLEAPNTTGILKHITTGSKNNVYQLSSRTPNLSASP